MIQRPLLDLAFIAGLCTAAAAQTLLKDINQLPAVTIGSSNPTSFQPLPGGRLLFVASTPNTGSELWVTDGTTTGTTMVAEIYPGEPSAGIRDFIEIATGIYVFTASSPGTGWELWRTDGTAIGTALVKDIRPGPDSSVAIHLTKVGNEVVFLADDGVHGTEPWRTDGTSVGTQLIADVVPGPGGMSNGTSEIAALGSNRFVFDALVNGEWELWVSDVTAAGTSSIYQFQTSTLLGPSWLVEYGNRVLFRARTATSPEERWVTDGTANGTFSLGVGGNGGFLVAGNTAYFSSQDAAHATELWKTDGTAAGTSMVIDLNPGGGFSGSGNPGLVGEIQGDALFFGTTANGRRLLRTDGTAGGTTELSTAALNGTLYSSSYGQKILGHIYYRIDFGITQPGLYRTDGTAGGTTLVTDIGTGSLGNIGSTLFLGGDDGSSTGNELWVTDGTPQGTQLFLDIVQEQFTLNSHPLAVGSFQDRVLFRADDGVNGRELWATDGTPQGTSLLVDLEPGAAPTDLTGLAIGEDRIMILANTTISDGDPWFSDGTTTGTSQLDILPANSGFTGLGCVAFDDKFLFGGFLPASGMEPWITDGTVAGTQMLIDLVQGSGSSYPTSWFRFGDALLFSASSPAGWGIWRTDGTAAGTTLLGNPVNVWGTYETFAPTVFQGAAYFRGQSNNGSELWRTDGTLAGTSLFLDLEPGANSSRPGRLTALTNALLFQARIGGQARIVATDGTPGNMTMLNFAQDEIAGPFPIDRDHAAVVLIGTNGAADELWITDGTQAGTTFVRAVETITPYPQHAKEGVDRLLLAMGSDSLSGIEIWSLDGAGTLEPVTDFATSNPWPREMTRVGEHLVFSADDGVHGVELHSVPFSATNDWDVEIYGSGCPGTNGLTPGISYAGTARVSSAQPFVLEMRDALPNTIALLAWSTDRGATAIPGCTIGLAGQIDTLATTTDAFGRASLPVFPTPSLLGLRLNTQWFGLDPAGAALGFLSATPALEFVYGP